MTTSEFIIGHSADDALERKQEVRKILWALLAALLVHLIVGYSIAVSGGLFSSHSVIEEDKPIELTFVDLNKPAEPKKNTMFMDTPDSKKTVEPPPEKTFESNANSRAASEQPATGDAPLPSQQGKDRPNMDLDTHQYSLANQGAQPNADADGPPTPNPGRTGDAAADADPEPGDETEYGAAATGILVSALPGADKSFRTNHDARHVVGERAGNAARPLPKASL